MVDRQLDAAVQLWRAGRHSDAELACNTILAATARRIDVRELLAEIYSSEKRFALAAEQLRHVADQRPNDAAIARRLGDALFASGDFAAAADSFRRAIALEPRNPRGHNNLGRCLASLRQHAAAIDCYRKALQLEERYAIAHCNLGVSLAEQGELEEAVEHYKRSLALNPRSPEAHTNLANSLTRLGRTLEALASFEQAVSLDPDNLTVRANHANGLRAAHRMGAALAAFEAILERQSDHLEALNNRAEILLFSGRLPETVAACDRLLEVSPDSSPGLLYKGLALNDLTRFEESAACFRRLLEVDPGQPFAAGYLQYGYRRSCDWSHTAEIAAALADLEAGKPSISPLVALSLTDSAPLQLACARMTVASKHSAVRTPIYTGVKRRHDRIRVAWLSADLRQHAVSFLLAGVFEQLDRSRFESVGISFSAPEESEFGTRVVRAFDAFIDVSSQNDRETAQMLHDMEIDIAVDLMGFTRFQRFNIFAHRFAPITVTYLGYPATSGAPYIDYILADDFVVPEGTRQHYSESVVYLPECYQANDDQRVIAVPAPTREELGLPSDAFVFCSFNNGYKVTPEIFDVWCRFLQATPQSVLWLLAETEASCANLREAARARGVDPQRLHFAGRMPYSLHLARLAQADLFVDSFPFNAGTTASDALWAGLPVLTLSGEAFPSRMAGSLLRAAGLPELICNDLASYEQVGLRLSRHRDELALLRDRLRVNRTRSPLFNTKRFTRHLESAFTTMYERHHAGQPPAHFTVPPLPA